MSAAERLPDPSPATGVDLDAPVLIGVSFDRMVRAKEFMLAVTRLQEDGRLSLRDAVFVSKDTDGKTSVLETVDLDTGRTALSGAVWTGLLGLLVGGPVGWLAGMGVGAGVGAITAKVVDLGVPDEWVDWFEQAVRPDTVTLVLLADDVEIAALEAEARRFASAELVHTTMAPHAMERLEQALR